MPKDLYLDNPCEIIELNSVKHQDEINVGYKECLKKLSIFIKYFFKIRST